MRKLTLDQAKDEIVAAAEDVAKRFPLESLYKYNSKDEPLTDEQLAQSRLRRLHEALDEYRETYNLRKI